MAENTYDLVIVGSGPAGLTAAVYAARYKLNTLILGKEFGGAAATAHKICNVPTYDEISGIEFMEKMEAQVRKFNIQIPGRLRPGNVTRRIPSRFPENLGKSECRHYFASENGRS
jgi:thioredoxin reductase